MNSVTHTSFGLARVIQGPGLSSGLMSFQVTSQVFVLNILWLRNTQFIVNETLCLGRNKNSTLRIEYNIFNCTKSFIIIGIVHQRYTDSNKSHKIWV